MNLFKVLFLLFLVPFGTGFAKSNFVLVSVAPHKFFVERIAGDTIDVGLIVPAGANPHSFEPTAKQVLEAGKADIWFRVGEGFESHILSPMQSYNPGIQIVDLRDGVDLIYEGHEQCGHAGCADPHIWMSPKLAMDQARTIAHGLTETYPEHKKVYAERLGLFLTELEMLDQKIRGMLSGYKNQTIMVSHPAFAYFCREYGLNQLSVEFEGRDPSPRQLTKILELGRLENIHTIFIQVQHSSKGARLVAKQIGANVEELDPLKEDYILNMEQTARLFSESLIPKRNK